MVTFDEGKRGDPVTESIETLHTFWLDSLYSTMTQIDKTMERRQGLKGILSRLVEDIKKYSGIGDPHRMEESQVVSIRRNVEGSDFEVVLSVPWQKKMVFVTVDVKKAQREITSSDLHDSHRFGQSSDWYRTHSDRTADTATHAVAISIDTLAGNPLFGNRRKYLAGFEIRRIADMLSLAGVVYSQGKRPFQIDPGRPINLGDRQESVALIGKFDNAIGSTIRHLQQFGDFL